ncbi:hypothetical protein WKA23_003820 [Yersinia enterocolitica]|nr:hypothetical protein [Yersinia enterocolitica]
MEQIKAPGILAGNIGEPITLEKVEPLVGFSSAYAAEGDMCQLWTKHGFTSDQDIFHQIARSFISTLEHYTQREGKFVKLSNCEMLLFIIHGDLSAEIWNDKAAVASRIIMKKQIQPGMIVFEKEVADILDVHFPLVEFKQDDKVICLFREGWRFGLYFDLNRDDDFSVDDMNKNLGVLHRAVKYKNIYDSMFDYETLSFLVARGWFPFAELINDGFDILQYQEKNDEVFNKSAAHLISLFDRDRVNAIRSRWNSRVYLNEKMPILDAAFSSYYDGNYIAAIKIILTEIEGVLQSFYIKANLKKGSSSALTDFAKYTAIRKLQSKNTLLFPEEFLIYLKQNTYCSFDLMTGTASANSRHSVGHGAAAAETYTKEKAIQAILTFDQIVFYL